MKAKIASVLLGTALLVSPMLCPSTALATYATDIQFPNWSHQSSKWNSPDGKVVIEWLLTVYGYKHDAKTVKCIAVRLDKYKKQAPYSNPLDLNKTWKVINKRAKSYLKKAPAPAPAENELTTQSVVVVEIPPEIAPEVEPLVITPETIDIPQTPEEYVEDNQQTVIETLNPEPEIQETQPATTPTTSYSPPQVTSNPIVAPAVSATTPSSGTSQASPSYSTSSGSRPSASSTSESRRIQPSASSSSRPGEEVPGVSSAIPGENPATESNGDEQAVSEDGTLSTPTTRYVVRNNSGDRASGLEGDPSISPASGSVSTMLVPGEGEPGGSGLLGLVGTDAALVIRDVLRAGVVALPMLVLMLVGGFFVVRREDYNPKSKIMKKVVKRYRRPKPAPTVNYNMFDARPYTEPKHPLSPKKSKVTKQAKSKALMGGETEKKDRR